MPAALPLPTVPYSILCDWGTFPQSQGREGDELYKAAQQAVSRWTAPRSSDFATSVTQDAFSYEPVPLKIVGTTSVKYRFVGRLDASSYPFD